jgi:threonine synthase
MVSNESKIRFRKDNHFGRTLQLLLQLYSPRGTMASRYTSTRDGSLSFTFEEALTFGYAPDGGLFVPETLPVIEEATLKIWSKLTYPKLSEAVLRLFIATEELSDEALSNICVSTFEGFDNSDHAVPIVKVGDAYVAELFHGPTFCFKGGSNLAGI